MKNLIVAKRYADALYAEAKEKNAVEQVAADLTKLKQLLVDSKDFSILVNSAALNVEEKLAVINAMGKSKSVSELVYAFLVVLTRNRRLSILPAVIKAVTTLIHEEKNEVEAEVSYAAEVDEVTRKALVAHLTKITSKNIILKETIDPSLLGGLRVVIGSTLYDASIRGRLDSLKGQLGK